jgi:transcriptional/translational regulatory protein YebC/TACO1
MEVALEVGAADVVTADDGSIEVLTPWEIVGKVVDAMRAAGLEPQSSEVAMIASTQAPLDKETAETVLGLIDALEDLDDVQNVYTNAEISAEVMEQLGG